VGVKKRKKEGGDFFIISHSLPRKGGEEGAILSYIYGQGKQKGKGRSPPPPPICGINRDREGKKSRNSFSSIPGKGKGGKEEKE